MRSRLLSPLPEDLRQWGLHIKVMEPCWMCPYGSSEGFANICIILSNSFGSKYSCNSAFTCLGVTRFISGHLQDRCNVLICDSDIGETIWINRKITALYPFKAQAGGAPDFTEVFSKREGDLDTPAFQEALALAKMHSEASSSRQEDILKLLRMGFVGRQQMVTLQTTLAVHRERCSLEVKRQPRDHGRRGQKGSSKMQK
jgi:hypothetical protein